MRCELEKCNEAAPQQRILGRLLAVAEQEKVTGGWDNYHNPISSWDLDNGQFSGLLVFSVPVLAQTNTNKNPTVIVDGAPSTRRSTRTSPSTEIRPISPRVIAVNHKAPSGPVVMP